nr:leucine zipper domain-containing protein [Streptomyces sp. Y2F8-2]
MTHANAPLSAEGRRRLIERCMIGPIAHVAAERGISRATASKWVNRHRRYGELGLIVRGWTPHHQPSATPVDVVTRMEKMRRAHKGSATRIAHELAVDGNLVSARHGHPPPGRPRSEPTEPANRKRRGSKGGRPNPNVDPAAVNTRRTASPPPPTRPSAAGRRPSPTTPVSARGPSTVSLSTARSSRPAPSATAWPTPRPWPSRPRQLRPGAGHLRGPSDRASTSHAPVTPSICSRMRSAWPL